MKKEYILFIDSGIGGLSTLAETYKLVPANFIYFADNKNCPYGSHSSAEIFKFLKDIIDKVLAKYFVRIVVLACNTATTSAIENLRETFSNLIFVGTEPAINLAKKLGYKKILCLSTPATAKQAKFLSLKNSVQNCNIVVDACSISDFAKNIEDFLTVPNFLTRLELEKNLFEIKQIAENFDCIVLGCTHYCLVAGLIFSMTKKPLVCGNVGVARRVFDMHKKLNCNQNRDGSSSLVFLMSLQNKNLTQKYLKIFKQILAKDENVC